MVAYRAKGLNGSYTVEAAIVFPIIFFAICAMIYLSLYMNDRALLKSCVNNVILKADNLVKHVSNVELWEIDYNKILSRNILFSLCGNFNNEEELLENYLIEELEFYLIEINYINIKISNLKIEVNLTYKINLPINVNKYFGDGIISFHQSRDIRNPSEFIRLFSALEDMENKPKKLDEIIKKISKNIKR